MAIDSAAKRASAHRVANPWARTLPPPDGTVGADGRAHAAGYYGGLFAAGTYRVLLPPHVISAPARVWKVDGTR